MELKKLADIKTPEEGSAEIDKLTTEAMKLVRRAEKIALKHKLEFSFSVAYGMGGWFTGFDPGQEYHDEEEDGPFEPDEDRIGWQPSSQSC